MLGETTAGVAEDAAGALATTGVEAEAAGVVVVPAAAGLLSRGLDSTLAVVTGRAPIAEASEPGGAIRITWPTSMRLGLSMLFHLAMSFQFCP